MMASCAYIGDHNVYAERSRFGIERITHTAFIVVATQRLGTWFWLLDEQDARIVKGLVKGGLALQFQRRTEVGMELIVKRTERRIKPAASVRNSRGNVRVGM